MKSSQLFWGVMLASTVAMGIGGQAWAADGRPLTGPIPADSTLSLARYYTASMANIGQFPGVLVRLSCDANASAGATESGERPPYDYALVLQGENVMHPLVPGTTQVRGELDAAAAQGAGVPAPGKYYPSTGAILVSSLVIRQSRAGDVPKPADGHIGRMSTIGTPS